MVVCVTTSAATSPAAGSTTPATTTHHLHFYMHDGYTGPHPTAVLIVNGTGAPLMPGVRFGDTVVMDDVLTVGPSRGSKQVGRAQGVYVTASQKPGAPAMMLTMDVVLAGYPGYESRSSVTVVGRNEVTAPVRELAVVGGTGRFRMATGYVLWKTASWKGKNAVLELDVFVRSA
ncbi:hypothetical protein EJB05_40723, partial [Eragrostis curvula]